MLEVTSLSKSFDGFKAVNNAGLSVKDGEIVAVIGPNGAGKTTFFNLITGVIRPDSGKVLFKGEDITGLKPYQVCRRGISRSFQVVNVFPRLSVFENVQVSVLSRQKKTWNLFTPSSRLSVDDTEKILENVGLTDIRDATSTALSHGERKVLEIAIALGGNPEFLILDEPTAGMSPEETSRCIDLIKQLKEKLGITILFCEHDMEIVFSISDRIMVMVRGSTIIEGTCNEVRCCQEVQDAYLGGIDVCLM
ncbi:MAG: ABC transporter ATP-binding protein [Syntrophorhabdaceae bacterium]|nr:ABC transporter ATP-binding protein [Syntrophorhabdaceae bacterium]MDD4195115.1 ABC transporter ATP-binding protein [Syntrophorhabdaceae bacterium]